MSNIIKHLRELEALRRYDAGKGPKAGYSPCDDIRYKEALDEALPKLLAVVEAHEVFIAYCEDRFTWSSKPDEWEYMTDEQALKEAKDALAALEEEG